MASAATASSSPTNGARDVFVHITAVETRRVEIAGLRGNASPSTLNRTKKAKALKPSNLVVHRLGRRPSRRAVAAPSGINTRRRRRPPRLCFIPATESHELPPRCCHDDIWRSSPSSAVRAQSAHALALLGFDGGRADRDHRHDRRQTTACGGKTRWALNSRADRPRTAPLIMTRRVILDFLDAAAGGGKIVPARRRRALRRIALCRRCATAFLDASILTILRGALAQGRIPTSRNGSNTRPGQR